MLVITLAAADPAAAQPAPPLGAPRALPPHEILTILRSTELAPLERPTRRGTTYALRALDADGDQVRVIVDARTGAILSVTPIMQQDLAPGQGVATAPRSTLPPDLGPAPIAPGSRARHLPPAPDGYIAPQSAPPVIYESNPPVIYGPRPPAAVPGAPAAGVPGDGNTSPQVVAPQPGGVLPPPPERFPQRATPGPEPKAKPAPPRRTVSAAPPQAPPLPKPRPEAPTTPAPAAAPAAAPGPTAAPSPAPTAGPSTDDVPH
jgi:hypothetical protein